VNFEVKVKMSETGNLEAALKYRELGFFVIPVDPAKKKPHAAWAYRKHKKPDAEEIKKWWHKWPDANVAGLTGKHSGFDVVDLDSLQAIARIEAEYGASRRPLSLKPDALRAACTYGLSMTRNTSLKTMSVLMTSI